MVKYPFMADEKEAGNQLTLEREEDAGGYTADPRSVRLIAVSTFFFWIGLYLYVPILPVYAQSRGASLSVVGIIVAAYAVPQLLLRIPFGIWSDSLGRQKPLIIGGTIMIILGAAGLMFSPNPLVLGISRVVTGIGAAVWGMYTVYMVSFYETRRSARAIAVLNIVCSGALVVATLSGGAISNYMGAGYTFLLAACMGGVSLVIVLFARERRVVRKASISWKGIVRVARRPLLITVSVMGIFSFFAQFTGTLGFLPVYAASIGASDAELGILTMLTMGISMAGALLVEPLVKRIGNAVTIAAAALMLGAALLLVPFIDEVPLLYVVQVFNGLGQGMLTTHLMSLSIFDVGPGQRATAMGFYQAMYAIGMLSGPLVSGFIADSWGLAVVFYLCAVLCLIVGGLGFSPVVRRARH